MRLRPIPRTAALLAVSIVGAAPPAAAQVAWFGSPEMQAEMQAGFEDVASGWSKFLTAWSDSSALTFRAWGARVAVLYLTEEETAQVYAWRATIFEEVAADPRRNAICGADALMDEGLTFEGLDFGPVSRFTGRALARHVTKRRAWRPPLNLETDFEVWEAFVRYLEDTGFVEVAEAFFGLGEDPISNEALCRLQAALYRIASERPGDKIGPYRIIDFVRSIDYLGLSA